jgi:hypothetical protein
MSGDRQQLKCLVCHRSGPTFSMRFWKWEALFPCSLRFYRFRANLFHIKSTMFGKSTTGYERKATFCVSMAYLMRAEELPFAK